MSDEEQKPVRVDRWLWAARLFRSRSLAVEACEGGRVEVNGRSVKAHKPVRPGDLLEVTLDREKRRLRVVGLSDRRGPAPVARQLYEDLTPPAPAEPPAALRERGAGRPTKRDRRQIERWRY